MNALCDVHVLPGLVPDGFVEDHTKQPTADADDQHQREEDIEYIELHEHCSDPLWLALHLNSPDR